MRAVKESAERVNGKEVYLIHEPMAAAIGIGVDIMQPKGNMIIDIGGGTTEIAVIALGGIVCDQSLKVAGDVFTNDIIYYMRTQHNLYVGDRTAEKIKIQIGAATEDLDDPPDEMSVQGRDLLTGKPKQIEISSPGLKPDFSIALEINLIASSVFFKFGAKPPSSPTLVLSTIAFRFCITKKLFLIASENELVFSGRIINS